MRIKDKLIKGSLFYLFVLLTTNVVSQDGFTVDIDAGCAPLIVQFTYTEGANPTNLSWDFGNGNTLSGDPSVDSGLLSPTISYLLSNSYTVTLEVTNDNGTTTFTSTNFITVFQDPIADFSATPTEGCGAFTVFFTDQSTLGDAPITQWNWDFGDGGSSNNVNPNYVYDTPGTFDVSLSITDQNGCNSIFSYQDLIEATDGVYPEFEVNTNSSCEIPTVISFTDLSTGAGILSYDWDFDNGNTSTSANPPSQSYNSYGFYNIILTLSNDLGCTQTYNQLITINEVNVDFSFDLNCIPSPSVFFNTSDPSMNTFLWNFGDPGSGSSNTSVFTNPAHVFSSPGTYTVTLTASNLGECESSYTTEVTILEGQDISYTIEPTMICEYPTSIPIIINNDNVDSYSWFVSLNGGETFESGNETDNLLVFDNSEEYIEEGGYNLILSVTYENGCEAFLQESNYFTVEIPNFNTYILPSSLCEGQEAEGYANATFSSGISSYLWTWGDGNISTDENSSNIYTTAGDYEAVFSIVTPEGCEKDTLIEISVGEHTFPDFTYPDTTVCIEEPVVFTYTGDLTDIDQIGWYYGGSFTGSGPSATIEINNIDSVHTISVITNNNGCHDTLIQTVSITGLGPKAEFHADESFYCKEEAPWISSILNVSDTTINTIFQWTFGDDYIDSTDAFTPGDIEFFEYGSHEITLYALDTITGCDYERTKSVNIDNFQIHFTDSLVHACDIMYYSGEMMFTDPFPIDQDKLIYHWDFGDGDTAITYTPDSALVNHDFNEAGSYYIQVTAINDYDCPDTTGKWIYIHPSPVASFTMENENMCPPFDLEVTNSSIEMDTAITYYEYLLSSTDSSYYFEEDPSIAINSAIPYYLTQVIIDGFGCSDTSVQTLNPHAILMDYNLPDFLCYNTEYTVENNIASEFPPLEFLWEFGNGESSTEMNPTILIDDSQEMVLMNTVLVSDSFGCTQVDSFYIYISIPELSYDFLIDEASCPPIFSDFAIFSDDDIDTFIIDYGDGESNSVSTPEEAENISHVYDLPGVYEVTFTVIDIWGCSSSLTVDSLVNVPGPWASFSFTPNSGCPPLEVSFEIIGQDNVADYFWVFGDGSTSDFPSPIHIYNLAGIYTPVLVIQDSINIATGDSLPCIVSIQGDDIVIDGPDVAFNVLNDTICYGEGIALEVENLTQTIPGFEINSYLWDFGDGNTSTDENPTGQVYSAPGYYTITLTVTTENGCEYFLVKNNAVLVMEIPEIYPLITYQPSCPSMLVNFTGDSSNAFPELSFLWNFGDGETSNQANTSHEYLDDNAYMISLEIQHYSCTFTALNDETIQSYSVPEAIIEASPLFSGNTVDQVQLTNESIGEESVEWWLEGVYYSNDDVINVTTQEDDILVYLLAFSSDGCVDTSYFSLSDMDWDIPNIITPNGDGLNDFFVLGFEEFGPCIGLSIYNRWGILIYKNTNYLDNWNGKNQNSVDVSDGTYFYVINICSNTKISGYITVKH